MLLYIEFVVSSKFKVCNTKYYEISCYENVRKQNKFILDINTWYFYVLLTNSTVLAFFF